MKTFYRPEMNVSKNQSFSPSAGKPKAFIEYLEKNGINLNLISDFVPVTFQDLELAHDRKMVQGILNLKVRNGFGNLSAEVAKSLPYTTGSMLAAAQYAVINGENTFSPTSGFHHAGYNYCGGFCTFNGLMVTAMKLLQSNIVKQVGIVDLDRHYGDGTYDIMGTLEQESIMHYTFGGDNVTQRNADDWLERLEYHLHNYIGCDVILYQAGADPHINDPLGGVLTTQQMKKRDEIIFRMFSQAGVPVVWNLAGGYQDPIEKVLELHRTTYEIAVSFTQSQWRKYEQA